VPYTQNIVGFDRERGIFSTDFFRDGMQKTAQDTTYNKKKIETHIMFWGGKTTFNLFFLLN
jgi:hypothetical protein